MPCLSSVDISFFTHATEDHEKTCKFVAEVLGAKEGFEISNLQGHFGNSIHLCKAVVTREAADEFAQGFFTKLSEKNRKALRSNLPRYLDEHGNLYIRVSKQLLFGGVIAFGESDAVKLRLKARRRGRHFDTTDTFLYFMPQGKEWVGP